MTMYEQIRTSSVQTLFFSYELHVCAKMPEGSINQLG